MVWMGGQLGGEEFDGLVRLSRQELMSHSARGLVMSIATCVCSEVCPV